MEREKIPRVNVRDGHELYRDQDHKIELQIRNGFRQFNHVVELVQNSRGQMSPSPEMILDLHRLAIMDIYECAGRFREWPVTIKGSSHKPPDHPYVPGLVAQMCETLIGNHEWSPVKACAYALWRLNWIHPFGGGNGRTSRALGHCVLCLKFGFLIPGTPTFPDQINLDRVRYQSALEDADAAWKQNVLDVSKMESLIDDLLVRQMGFLENQPPLQDPTANF